MAFFDVLGLVHYSCEELPLVLKCEFYFKCEFKWSVTSVGGEKKGKRESREHTKYSVLSGFSVLERHVPIRGGKCKPI